MFASVRLQVCLFRHGETHYNRDRRYSGRRDVPLTEEGLAAFERWRDVVYRWPVTMVWTSPLRRAVVCARMLRASPAIPLVWSWTLVEMDFGLWEGRSFEEVQHTEAWRRWVADPWHQAPPAGESLLQVARRVAGFWDLIRAPHHRGLWIVVSHVTPIKVLLAWAMGIDPAHTTHVFLQPASLSVLTVRENGWVTVDAVNHRWSAAELVWMSDGRVSHAMPADPTPGVQ